MKKIIVEQRIGGIPPETYWVAWFDGDRPHWTRGETAPQAIAHLVWLHSQEYDIEIVENTHLKEKQ